MFNKLHRQISSETENAADEYMSVIRFWTNAKGDLPHHS